MRISDFSRRRFLQMVSATAAWAMSSRRAPAASTSPVLFPRGKTLLRKPHIGIQVPAISFVDEGIDPVLDNLQLKGHVNTVWLNTYGWERGVAGRQLAGFAFPDHGPQEPDRDLVGGAFFDYDPKYFRRSALGSFRAPDYNRRNILAEVLPKAKARGMDVMAWDFFFPDRGIPPKVKNWDRVVEIDVHGQPTWAPCNNAEDYRQHMFGRVECYLKQYPELAGIAWGQERMGPLMNMIGGTWGLPIITCFCPHCQRKARARDLSVDRAREGFLEMEKLFAAAAHNDTLPDGYFVTFWRLLSKYPEILGWEKLWTDSYHEIRSEVYRIAKSIAPEKPIGFHILHNATLSPFFRGEEDYAEIKQYADFVKPAMYNVVAGGRMALFLDRLSGTLFHDAKPEDFLAFYYKIMGYQEAPYADLPTTGLLPDYVTRETRRILTAAGNEMAVYPGIDLGVPAPANEKQATGEDARAAVKAAFAAGAQGVILSRKYSEIKLTTLEGAGRGLREAGAV